MIYKDFHRKNKKQLNEVTTKFKTLNLDDDTVLEEQSIIDNPSKIKNISVICPPPINMDSKKNVSIQKAKEMPFHKAKPENSDKPKGVPPPPLQVGNKHGKIGNTPKTNVEGPLNIEKTGHVQGDIDKTPKNSKILAPNTTGAHKTTSPVLNQPQQIEIDIKESIKKIVRECIEEMGYGAYKVGHRSYKTANDNKQDPHNVWNPEVTEEEQKEQLDDEQ